jgi:hypothetical protein
MPALSPVGMLALGAVVFRHFPVALGRLRRARTSALSSTLEPLAMHRPESFKAEPISCARQRKILIHRT